MASWGPKHMAAAHLCECFQRRGAPPVSTPGGVRWEARQLFQPQWLSRASDAGRVIPPSHAIVAGMCEGLDFKAATDQRTTKAARPDHSAVFVMRK